MIQKIKIKNIDYFINKEYFENILQEALNQIDWKLYGNDLKSKSPKVRWQKGVYKYFWETIKKEINKLPRIDIFHDLKIGYLRFTIRGYAEGSGVGEFAQFDLTKPGLEKYSLRTNIFFSNKETLTIEDFLQTIPKPKEKK